MLQVIKHHLTGVYLVLDSFLEPCAPFLQLVCEAREGVCVINFDTPPHRLTWVTAQCEVVDAYGASLDQLSASGAKKGVVIVDGISLLVREHGVAVVLDRVLALDATCVLVTAHLDLLEAQDVRHLRAACGAGSLVFRDEGVETYLKRKGGKVSQFREHIEAWTESGPVLKSIVDEAAPSTAKADLVLEDANQKEKAKLQLPFVKTSVQGKMIFDVDDMKQGDYEDDADKSSGEEADEVDPDGDLDF